MRRGNAAAFVDIYWYRFGVEPVFISGARKLKVLLRYIIYL